MPCEIHKVLVSYYLFRVRTSSVLRRLLWITRWKGLSHYIPSYVFGIDCSFVGLAAVLTIVAGILGITAKVPITNDFGSPLTSGLIT